MQRWKNFTLIAAAALALAACNDSSDPGPAKVRVIHASPDAPKVNVLVDGEAVLSAVDYKAGSGFLDVKRGMHDIAVQAITPTGTPTVIDLPGAMLDGDTEYSVLAVGKVAAGTLQPLVIDNPVSSVPAGKTRVQVVHASPDAPTVDVYVTAPGAPLEGASPLGTFAFKGTLGPVDVDSGNYEVRVTPTGSSTVVYDSGTLTLAPDTSVLVAAVTSAVAGGSPISLLVNDGASQAEVLDKALAKADVRVAHLSPDAPAVDVVVNDNFASPAFTGATFPNVTDYASLDPATYNVKVVDNATQALTVINADLPLASGKYYTVAAVNFLSSIEPLVIEDKRRSIATEAQVRIVHASPTAGDVDIYVTAPGVDINSVSPAFAAVPFKGNTGYVSLAAGDYDVKVTPAGSKSPVAIAASLTVAAGGIYSAFARDNAGGGAPLGVVVVDELD